MRHSFLVMLFITIVSHYNLYVCCSIYVFLRLYIAVSLISCFIDLHLVNSSPNLTRLLDHRYQSLWSFVSPYLARKDFLLVPGERRH